MQVDAKMRPACIFYLLIVIGLQMAMWYTIDM